MTPDGNDNLNKAEHLLNKPGSGVFNRKRSHLTPLPDGVAHDWQNETPSMSRRSKTGNGVKGLFAAALVFFVAAVGYASYLFVGGTNRVSGDNIEIAINGPATVKGGEVQSFEILLANNNNTPLELADLIVTFPEGTRSADEWSKPLSRYRKSIGSVGPNQTVSESMKAVFYGGENTEKEITVGFEYRTEGSNAIYAKEKKFSFHITSAPLTLSVAAPSDANSGQSISVTVRTVGNSSEPLKGILTRVSYPPGFRFVSATPLPITGTTDTWRLGDVPAQGERAITIQGIIEGQDEEAKAFRIVSGAGGVNDGENSIVVPYSETTQVLTIKRPFVGLNILVGDSNNNTVVAEGAEVLHASIEWVNNLPSRVMDGQLEVKLSGTALDQAAVSAQNGFYRSADNTIVWNKSTVPELANIEAGGKQRVTFSFASAPLLTSGESIYRQPSIDLEFKFIGTRIADTAGSGGAIQTVARRKIQLNTETQLVSRAVHYVGPLPNSGPLPPKVGKETTYTVIWSVVNSSNDLVSTQVKANLPNYMRFIGNALPKDEKVLFDERTGIVSWDLGAVKAGSGLTVPVREVAFQVALTPSLSQADLIVPIIGDATLTGTDDFTKALRTNTKHELTTELLTDTKSKEGEYRVAR